MRAFDVLSLAVAALVGLVTLTLQPWTAQWWASVVVVGTLAAGALTHIIWNNLSPRNRAYLAPATWSPDGRVQNGKWRALGGIVLAGLIVGVVIVALKVHHADNNLEESPPHQPIIPPPSGSSLVSRADKFIFACDIPRDPHWSEQAYAKQKEEWKKELRTWGQVIGFEIDLSDIDGGFRVSIRAETVEARNRMASAGVWPSITTVFVDIRRIGPRLVVSAYADLPKELSFFAMFPPDPTLPQVIAAEKQLGELLGAPGTCHLI